MHVHAHTCPECYKDWLCCDRWGDYCKGLVQYKRHPNPCRRSSLQDLVGRMFLGLHMHASLSQMFAAQVATPKLQVCMRSLTADDVHGVTLELDDQTRIAANHPELHDLHFEQGRWRAYDAAGTVTHSKDGTRWSGAYGVKHNPQHPRPPRLPPGHG